MKKVNILGGAIALVAPICGTAVVQAQEDRGMPNVLLIITDQQTSEALSIAGNPLVSTPNMDRLASKGVRFVNTYCNSPVSSPSRASFLTGKMASEVGVDWNDNSKFLPGVQTIGDILRREGYNTVWCGKWHVPEIFPVRKMDRHYDEYGFYFLPFHQAPYRDWLLGAETDPPTTVAAVKYLEEYDSDEPLFLAVSYHNPHDICMYPRKDGWETEDNKVLNITPFGDYQLPSPMGIHPDSLESLPPLPVNFDAVHDEPEFIVDKRTKPNPYGDEVQLAANFTDKEWQGYINAYYRLVELIDIEVGKLLDAAYSSKINDNLLIIFTSDHGDGVAAHRWAAKLSLYEEPSTVPFIMSYEGVIKGGSESEYVASLVDLFPTICDYANITTDIDLAGKSLKNKISKGRDKSNYIVCELADIPKQKSRIGYLVRTDRYKYMSYSEGEKREQLFDLKKDKYEMNDLSQDKKYEKIILQHRALLEDWFKKRANAQN